jgi:sec-independent protein translocase protein TatA
MMGIGAPELLIVALIVILLFGGAKLPKLARSLGQAKNEFEAGSREGGKAEDETAKDAAKKD